MRAALPSNLRTNRTHFVMKPEKVSIGEESRVPFCRSGRFCDLNREGRPALASVLLVKVFVWGLMQVLITLVTAEPMAFCPAPSNQVNQNLLVKR